MLESSNRARRTHRRSIAIAISALSLLSATIPTWANSIDAAKWGRRFYGEEPFHILTTRVPSGYAEKLFSLPNLDNIGPARYVQNLDELNQIHLGIAEYAP